MFFLYKSLLLLLLAGSGLAQTFTNNTRIDIPGGGSTNNRGPANPYLSNITVSGFSGTITKLTVTLKGFNHTYPNDVDLGVTGVTFLTVGRLIDPCYILVNYPHDIL